jgi:hypothetical protein
MNTLWPFIAPTGMVIFCLSIPKLLNNRVERIALDGELFILVEQCAMVIVEYTLRFFLLTDLSHPFVQALNKFAPRYFLYRANRALRPGRLIGVQGRRIPVSHAANGENVLVLAYGFGYQISQLHRACDSSFAEGVCDDFSPIFFAHDPSIKESIARISALHWAQGSSRRNP